MEYPYPLNITLKPFQLDTFNRTKDHNAEIINFSTGTGKTIYFIAKANWLLKSNKVDKIVVVCRNHNKTNWHRQFNFVASLDSVVVDITKGTAVERRKARRKVYSENPILILNYEKLRSGSLGDVTELKASLKGQRVVFCFDEAPTMLKTLNTQVYKGTRSIIKSCSSYNIILTATPLENSPEDVYAITKLIAPDIFTNVSDFRKEYGLMFNPWNPYKVDIWDQSKLPEISNKIDHLIFKANKYTDPEIASQFPKETWEDIIIDMSDHDRTLYNNVLDDVLKSDQSEILVKILVMQLICDNPLLLNYSSSQLAKDARKYTITDKYSNKLYKLKEMIDEIDSKIVVFNMYSELGADRLHSYITKWGHKAVLYDGNLKERQAAEDRFRTDPKVKVFVSSDKGSDSINLEAGSVVINYNLPYKYTTLLQRVNRINRITSNFDNIYYYNLLTANSIEDRKLQIISQKKNLQEVIFGGSAPPLQGISDMNYILTG